MTDNASIVRDPIEDLRQLVQEATGNVPSWTLTRGIRALDALSAELSDLKADLERAREEERERIIGILADPHNQITWKCPSGSSVHADPRFIRAALADKGETC